LKICIIAEAGVNHNGDIDIAKRMIDVAKEAGVSYVKFETYVTKALVSSVAKRAEYQIENFPEAGEEQFAGLARYELNEKAHIQLADYCKRQGVSFLSTPFDLESIELLDKMGMALWKIPSGEITNLPYLRRISMSDKPILLSTGMSEMEEIRQALGILQSNGNKDITLLHCNSQYPTPFCDANLRAMETLGREFGLPVGYSDHTLGVAAAVAAAALGAVVIEKHFTLDKNMEGPDHKMSIDPTELRHLVSMVRNVEQALGNGKKKPTESEKVNLHVARKSIVASKPISRGERFTADNITTKRPGNGVSPMEWDAVLQQTAKRDFNEDELIEL